MRYTSKRGTVINIPDGLTAKQIADIKADADAGYGTRAQETANRLGKQVNTVTVSGPGGYSSSTSTGANGLPTDFNAQEYLRLNPDVAASGSDAAEHYLAYGRYEGRNYGGGGATPAGEPQDDDLNYFSLDEAGLMAQRKRILAEIERRGGKDKAPNYAKRLEEVDDKLEGVRKGIPVSGNPTGGGQGTGGNAGGVVNRGTVDSFLAGIFDNFKPLDLSGAPKVMSADDLEKFRGENQDALYREETKYLDRNRSRDLEEAKQEMANRGIPYDPAAAADPNSKNLYGRTIGGINEGYRMQEQSALDRARLGADQRMATQAGVNRSAYDAFVNSAVEGYRGQLDAMASGNDVLNTLINEYGLTREEALARLKIKSDEKIARMATAARGGGGGGGGGGSNSGGGFEIVG